MAKVEKKWKLPKKPSGKPKFGYPDWLISVLENRGLRTEQEISSFLEPKYEELLSTEVFENISKAVARVLEAVKNNENVAVYGDYDVDGITATALISEVLTKIGIQKIEAYIPHREEEGYGLNTGALKELVGRGVKLIISVDCGITSREIIDSTEFKGLDFIVCDHHQIEKGKLPKKSINLHPGLLVRRLNLHGGSTSKNREDLNLSACGMVFFFAMALQKEFPEQFPEGQEKWLLDLVALATICDVVPLLGQNRLLASFGLKVLAKTRRLGLIELAKTASLDLTKVGAYDVGFLLGPRLNAAGRLKHAREALSLLTTKDRGEAAEIARHLAELNQKRQALCERILSEAKSEIISTGCSENEIFLLSSEKWPRGVVGIIAGRLAEEYSRPVIIFEHDGEAHHGSARSVGYFDITEALGEVSEHLIKYGGHSKAAGVSVASENFTVFQGKLLEVTRAKIGADTLFREINIDAEIKTPEINEGTMDLLHKLEPYGYGNPTPVFLIRGAQIENPKLVGKDQNHLKFTIKAISDKESGTSSFSAIYFNTPDDIRSLISDRLSLRCDLAFTLRYNEWNNRKSIELRVVDMRPSKVAKENHRDS